MNNCGGQTGVDQDRFQAAMQSNGFSFPAGPVRLWTSSQGDHWWDCRSAGNGGAPPEPECSSPHYKVWVEGDSWWNPARKPDDTAMVPFCRNLTPGEAD